MQKRNTTELIDNFIDCFSKHPILFIGVFCAFSFLLVIMEISWTIVSIIGFSLIVVTGILLYFKGNLNQRNMVLLLFFAGFILRLQYILYTGCMERQHDVEVFGSGHGHSGYIEYLYSELRLPDFDVREVWQFYHPPLHHVISAVFLKFFSALGVEYNLALEGLQSLTLFYSSLCMLISYRIIRELGIKGGAALASFAVIAFHPTFIIFAGSINNDLLSLTFQLAAILYTIRWYKNKTLCNIIVIALCIGLGMMTKLSAWMVAPAVAFVFLYSLIEDLKAKRNKLSFYIKQYSVFAIVCVPLGLWWSIRNYILYSVPPNYIPLLEFDNPQYIGFHSVSTRLFDFGWHQFQSVFDMWGNPYYEYNPTVGLLKTAMFGESINDSTYPQISISGTALFWLGTALALIGFAYMLYFLISSKCKLELTDWFLLGLFIVIFVMYYYFCISFPFTCTQNIRYASPLILVGSIYIGKSVERQKAGNGRGRVAYLSIIYSLVGLFCLFSMVTYTLIGV